jgi:hypothetical protein
MFKIGEGVIYGGAGPTPDVRERSPTLSASTLNCDGKTARARLTSAALYGVPDSKLAGSGRKPGQSE